MKTTTPTTDDRFLRARSVAYLVASKTGSTFFNPADDAAMEALSAAIAILAAPDPRIEDIMHRDRDSFISGRDAQLLLGEVSVQTLIEYGVLRPPVRLDGWHKYHRLGDVLDARERLDREHREAQARPERLAHVKRGGHERQAQRRTATTL